MWSSDRRTLLIACAALAGCGFHPVYGPGGSAQGLAGTIQVQAPDSTREYLLVERLETRLGQPTAPRYDLGYTLETEEVGVGVTTAQETTRYHVIGKLTFTLTEIGTGKVATSGSVNAFTAYAATGSTVSTLTASQDAYRRLMVILADDLVSRLQASAGTWR
jgi:LPS-assembly lipoprotein